MILDSTDNSRPKTSGARREAFVAAARDSFFSLGYGGTSMSAIAATVGGSKSTLWSYFPSKQDLFAAVVDDLVQRHATTLEVALDPDGSISDSLRRMGKALLCTLHSRPIVELQRLTIGEATRFPELAKLFHERAPARGKARLRHFIEQAMARGKLRRGDPTDAGRQFAGMLMAGSFQLRLFGLIDKPSDAEMDSEIEAALDAFMRAWDVTATSGGHPV